MDKIIEKYPVLNCSAFCRTPSIVFLLLCLSLFSGEKLLAQKKFILTTDINTGWAITKKTQAYPVNPIPPSTNWLTNKSPDILDNTWTKNVVIANVTTDQIIPVNNVGNNAEPIWIAKSLCNHIEFPYKPTTYYFRNTFYLSDCINIESARLQFTTDNICRVYVNGLQIARNGGWVDFPGSSVECEKICFYYKNVKAENPPAKQFNSAGVNIVEITDIKDYLIDGINVIAIENLNTGGCETNYAWICANLEVTFSGSLITPEVRNLQNYNCAHGGSFEVIPTGGEPPFLFTLNNQAPQSSGMFEDLEAGDYEVTIEDATGCITKLPVVIENLKIFPQLKVEDFDIETDCYDTTASITLDPYDNGNVLRFSLDHGTYVDQSVFSGLSPGIHEVSAINEFGCTSQPYYFEIFFEDGKIYKNDVINLCHGASIELYDTIYQTSTLVQNTIVGPRCDTIHSIDLRFEDLKETNLVYEICPGETVNVNGEEYQVPGSFTQGSQGRFGCDSTINIRIDYKDERICAEGECAFFIPNVFTPNNDGINDLFEVKADYITISQLSVFNRWGQVVYSGNGPVSSWNGMIKGSPAEPGNYVYLLRGECVNGFPFIRSGSVTLVR